MKKIYLLLFFAVFVFNTYACTNFLVGKKASTDGSIYVTYNADSYGMFGKLIYFPRAKHPKGSMRQIYDGDSHKYLGEIKEVEQTYAVNGYINEYQLTIMESTFGGRPELEDPSGIIDYVSLMRLGLQRAKTAREAIKVMTELVDEYGYASEGESFSIADKNEVWVMEMIGKGPHEKGANWVAVRIPDDCISAHANQSRIHKLSDYKTTEVLRSKDLIGFARRKGYFSGKDKDFDFSAAYSPADFGAIRFCEARAWSFFNRYVNGMEKYIRYVDGHHIGDSEIMPLYFKPSRLLNRQDLMNAMRDHFEGTPFDVRKDIGMGACEMPYRPTPLTFEYKGKKYFNERPISTQQTADTYIAQLRSFLPDMIGGVLWYGQDDPNMIAYTPIYCDNTIVPSCYDDPNASDDKFSWNSAFWVCNWISNMTYPRYNVLFPALERVRNALDSTFTVKQPLIEQEALKLYKENPIKAQAYLNEYSISCANTMMTDWKKLGEYMIVKFNDMTIKPEKNGKFLKTKDGICVPPTRPGYSDEFKEQLIERTKDKYLVPSN